MCQGISVSSCYFFLASCLIYILMLFIGGGLRNDGMEDQYSVLIRFDDQDSTDGFYNHYNRRRFSSLEVCLFY